jgi:hypothetical protein
MCRPGIVPVDTGGRQVKEGVERAIPQNFEQLTNMSVDRLQRFRPEVSSQSDTVNDVAQISDGEVFFARGGNEIALQLRESLNQMRPDKS